MLRFGINLLLTVNYIKCVVLKFTESKLSLNHSFIHSRTVLISFRKSVGFELEAYISVIYKQNSQGFIVLILGRSLM